MPEDHTKDSLFGHHGVPTESEFSRSESLYKNWEVDGRLSVWIEIVWYTTDKTQYVGDDHRFMLHIFSTLKHTLPDYDWAAADEKLEKDVKWHLEHFNMPVWNRIMEKLVHDDKYDGLQVAMEQLMAYKVRYPRLPGLPRVLEPYRLRDFKFPTETHHITMEDMVRTLIEIIDEARASMKHPLERTDKVHHVFKLYKQDLKDLKARVESIHSSIGI